MSIYHLSKAFPEDQFIFPYFENIAIPQINSTDIDFDSLLAYTTTPYSFMMSYYQRIHINVGPYDALNNDTASNITESLRYIKDICNNEPSYDFNAACKVVYTQIDLDSRSFFDTNSTFSNITITDDEPDLFFDVNVLPRDEEDFTGIYQNATNAFFDMALTVLNSSKFDNNPQNIFSYPNYVLGYIPQNNTKNVFDLGTIQKRDVGSYLNKQISQLIYRIKKDTIHQLYTNQQSDIETTYSQAVLVSSLAAKLESHNNPASRILSKTLQGMSRLGMASALLETVNILGLVNVARSTGSVKGVFNHYKDVTDAITDMYKEDASKFTDMTFGQKLSFLYNSKGIQELGSYAMGGYPVRMIESVLDDIKDFSPEQLRSYSKLKKTLKVLKALRYCSDDLDGTKIDQSLSNMLEAVRSIDPDTYNEIVQIPAGTLDTISENVDDVIEIESNNPDNTVDFTEINPDNTPIDRDEDFFITNEGDLSSLGEESQSMADRIENVYTSLNSGTDTDATGTESLDENYSNLESVVSRIVSNTNRKTTGLYKNTRLRMNRLNRVQKRSPYNRIKKMNFRSIR